MFLRDVQGLGVDNLGPHVSETPSSDGGPNMTETNFPAHPTGPSKILHNLDPVLFPDTKLQKKVMTYV